jgi:hypothetical protein
LIALIETVDVRLGREENVMVNCECQNDSLATVSDRLSRVSVAVDQVKYYLKSAGLTFTAKRIVKLLATKGLGSLGFKRTFGRTPPVGRLDEVLDLQPGELVEVKSEEEIKRTVDGAGRHRGLTFTAEMREYCGRQFRVFKRVRKICLEGIPGEMRQLKNTVILEGVICNGGSRGCDRSCFLFWREAWLRRVNDNDSDLRQSL